jgi:hypothetical protein
MGAAGAEGEPCAEIDQHGKGSQNGSADYSSAALLTRDSPADTPNC